MANVGFRVRAREYVQPEPYIEVYSQDVLGLTRTHAPLQVQFRVKDLEGLWGREAREIGISWNFGDTDEDFSALSELSATEMLCDRNANTAIKPRAGHVYQSGGNYVATATLRDVAGNVKVLQSPEIVVVNQDDFYLDANTWYFAQDNDFTGVPVGANTLNFPDGDISSFFADEFDFTNESNRRYLLKAGQANDYFGGSLMKLENTTNFLLGSWGAGTPPRLKNTELLTGGSVGFVLDGLRYGSDYDPSGDTSWWTGDRFGVQGTDWFPKDPLPEEPPKLDPGGSSNMLINNMDFAGTDIVNAGTSVTNGIFVNNTRIRRYFDYGFFQGNENLVFVGSEIAQPVGTSGRATGSLLCVNRGNFNTYGCSDLDGIPIFNDPAHAPFRHRFFPDLMSKCFIRAGGGHSRDGLTPQPAVRVSTSENANFSPQSQLATEFYISQCHIVGTVSTSNDGKFYPFGLICFDSCVLERTRFLNTQIGVTYGIDVVNCLFLARDPLAGDDALSGTDKFIGTVGTADFRPNKPITEQGGNHSLGVSWFINNTFALIEDNGKSVSGKAIIIEWEEFGAPNPPRYIGRNNAFFRLDSRMATSEYVPLAAPISELDQATFLPNSSTTFDTLQDDQYMPLDFDGNVRTPADAISGFRKRTV